MSRVTDVIILAPIAPNDADHEIAFVNNFLREAGGGGQFIEVSHHAGGTKHMECRVYVSTFNYVDTLVISRAVDQAPWRDREMIQLLIKEQEEDVFMLHSINL